MTEVNKIDVTNVNVSTKCIKSSTTILNFQLNSSGESFANENDDARRFTGPNLRWNNAFNKLLVFLFRFIRGTFEFFFISPAKKLYFVGLQNKSPQKWMLDVNVHKYVGGAKGRRGGGKKELMIYSKAS